MAGNIKGITIEIDGNTSKLTKALSDVNRDLKDTQNQLKSVDKLLKIDPGNIELLEQKQRLLGKSIEDTKDKLELLKTAQEQAREALTRGDIGQDEYDALTREVIATEQQLQSFETQAEECNDAIDMSRSESELNALGDAADGAEDDVRELGDASTSNGSIIEDAFEHMEGVIATLDIGQTIGTIKDAVADLAEEVFNLKVQWDNTAGSISKGTGATGQDLRDFTEIAYNAMVQVKDANLTFEDMGNIVGEVNTRFGYTDDTLEDFSVKIAQFSKVTGEDGVSATDMIADNVRQWGDECMTTDELMDSLVYTSQACGKSAGELGAELADNAFQFQQLGLSQADALELMAKIAWTGGEVSTVTGAMTTAYAKLNGKVEDVPGTLQLAIDQMENWDGKTNILSEDIGDTGLTMEDVFGRKASTVAKALSTASSETEGFAFNLDDADGRMIQTANDSTTLQDEVSNLKNQFSAISSSGIDTYLNDTSVATDNLTSEMRDNINAGEAYSEKLQSASQTLKRVWSTAMSNMSTSSDIMLSDVDGNFADIAKTAQNKTSEAYKSTDANMKKIKGTTNFSWSLPRLSLPHFTSSGKFSLNPPSVPRFSVSWYGKGYENAYALDGAQIFGSMGNNLLAGGERAGREIVLGESYFQRTMASALSDAVQKSGDTFGDTVINVYGAPGQNIRELANIIEKEIADRTKRRKEW